MCTRGESILAEIPPPQKKNNQPTKPNQNKKEKNLIMDAVVWPVGSHSLPVSPFIFTGKCSLL